jgi:ABC-2 type transport system permease protein
MIKKELHTFFASPIGYLVIALFLIINGLFLFIFNTEFNILNAGFADLNAFFYLTPYVFIFLISAITMRSFSDEIQAGTIEILKTKPITNWQIILGKYFGALLLIVIALIPTLIYVISIYKLGNPIGNLDIGSIVGSYIGLLFLASTYTAIGIFTSTFSNNQIVAFLLAIFISFIMYYGFEFLTNLAIFKKLYIQNFGMHHHFQSMSRGVLDSRDLIYFISTTAFFLILTRMRINNM